MRRRYRSQAGIIHDILLVLSREGPINSTRLAQLANLPYDRLRELLDRLVAEGLVETVEEGDRKLYRITPQGLDALRKLQAAKEVLERLGYKF
ncbi:transcriptional regulator PadR family protein [Pyrolobus fumarii 1A]|uniref:Transcriptional regulator PadR family protein n=1 Tax=Pyrolobus fumarii (strain DSM 11204 / 1A) TaxID=694429 RepID=G0EES5_PYRF1|nr:winged helix-turn-helix domain-containing protein [Pyrolobus fumarii]AEM38897.1 transcriptional regulator PadR family protein [Pyrolobus fumarii 1A]